MRILVLEFSPCEKIAGFGERLNDRLVGVALIALVVDDAVAGKPWRFLGEETVGVNRIGDAGVDILCEKCAAIRHPNIEVVAAVARRSMNKARACFVANVLAIKKRYGKIVSRDCLRQRMTAGRDITRIDVPDTFEPIDSRSLENFWREAICYYVEVTRFSPIILWCGRDKIKSISNFR